MFSHFLQIFLVLFTAGFLGYQSYFWFHPFWFALIMACVLGLVNAHFWFSVFNWARKNGIVA